MKRQIISIAVCAIGVIIAIFVGNFLLEVTTASNAIAGAVFAGTILRSITDKIEHALFGGDRESEKA
ncbi:hypothetical protein HY439_00710 [Candidatus Microgenomates bacterium]|nr:hypothetical protein [Candidatus Microgenomates bacterium]